MNLEELQGRWNYMWELKEAFAFGDDSFDMEEYKGLVKRTYYCIKDMHRHISTNDYSEITSDDVIAYMQIVSLISMYSASCCSDESEGHIFAISRLLAFDLADLAVNYSKYEGDEDFGAPDGVIVSLEGYSYGLDKNLVYDVNKGDLSDYIEFAELIGC